MVIESVEVKEPFLQVLLCLGLNFIRLGLFPCVANLVIVTMDIPVLSAEPTKLEVAMATQNATFIESVASTERFPNHALASPRFLDAVLALRA